MIIIINCTTELYHAHVNVSGPIEICIMFTNALTTTQPHYKKDLHGRQSKLLEMFQEVDISKIQKW